MEAHQRLTSFGPSRSYSFLHYSVQEFLAAWHMFRLDSEKQAKAVSDVLHSSPLSPVLPFFAGLTGLSSPAVREILLKVTKYPLDKFSVLAAKPRTESVDRRRLALALLNCTYESQDHTLCDYVNTPRGKDQSMEISFDSLGLEPTDCLSIGYFMAHQSSCILDLTYCSIGDVGLEALMTQLRHIAETSTISCTNHRLILHGNTFTSRGMKLVSTVIQTPLLSGISFHYCWLPTQVATNLTYLIEGLSRRSTSFGVGLPDTVTSDHIHYLVLLLTTCRLQLFQLETSNVTEGMPFIAEALKQTTSPGNKYQCTVS